MIVKQDGKEGWVLPAGGADAREAGDLARDPGFKSIQILSTKSFILYLNNHFQQLFKTHKSEHFRWRWRGQSTATISLWKIFAIR